MQYPCCRPSREHDRRMNANPLRKATRTSLACSGGESVHWRPAAGCGCGRRQSPAAVADLQGLIAQAFAAAVQPFIRVTDRTHVSPRPWDPHRPFGGPRVTRRRTARSPGSGQAIRRRCLRPAGRRAQPAG